MLNSKDYMPLLKLTVVVFISDCNVQYDFDNPNKPVPLYCLAPYRPLTDFCFCYLSLDLSLLISAIASLSVEHLILLLLLQIMLNVGT